jgi:micrococcal nuclease
MNRLFFCLISLALVTGAHAENLAELAGVSASPKESSPFVIKPDGVSLNFAITKAIGGDILQLESGKSLKLLGVKSPEPPSPNSGGDYFNKEATEFADTLTKGKEVTVTFEKRKVDSQDRWLGYVWLPDGEFLNQKIIAEGYGVADSKSTIRKDYQEAFEEAQEKARNGKAGLWANPERALDLLDSKTERLKTRNQEASSPSSPDNNSALSQFLKSQPSVSPTSPKGNPVQQQTQPQQMRPTNNQRLPAISPGYSGYGPGMAQPGMLPPQNYLQIPQGSGTSRRNNRRYEGSYHINYNPDGTIRGFTPKTGNPPSRWRYGVQVAPAPDPRDSSGLRMK